MKIALAFPEFHRRGGVERVAVDAANHLQRRGHSVTVYACRVDRTVLEDEVDIKLIGNVGIGPCAGLRNFGHAARWRIDRDGGFDAVGGFGVLAPPDSVTWAGSVHRRWLEVAASDPWPARLKRRLNPFHRVARRLEEQTYGGGSFRKIIALSDDERRHLRRFYDVPEESVEVLGNGFDPEVFRPPSDAERERSRQVLGVQPEDRVIAFVANEAGRKGLAEVLEAMARLNDARIKLLAVGRLPEAAWKERAAALGVGDRVCFTGPAEGVQRFYAAADAFCLPTRYEAWGLVIVEALACGLPVVTSRLAGAAAAVRPGFSGELLEDPRDVDELVGHLRRVLDGGHTDREAIAASVREHAWDHVIVRYERVLAEAFGVGAAGATRLVGAKA